MPVRIVRLGSDRLRGEGTRLGTVRRPPRGVRKSLYSAHNWFDVWLPNLAPSTELIRKSPIETDGSGWKTFSRRYEAELKRPEQSHLLDLLAALSHTTDFSVGCYCADQSRCHRSLLRRALKKRSALVK